MSEPLICPKCGFREPAAGIVTEFNPMLDDFFRSVIRQGKVLRASQQLGDGSINTIIDVGYGCPKCRHEFGFEVFTEPPEPRPPAGPDTPLDL